LAISEQWYSLTIITFIVLKIQFLATHAITKYIFLPNLALYGGLFKSFCNIQFDIFQNCLILNSESITKIERMFITSVIIHVLGNYFF
jgi:hypothetical protein